MTVCDVRNPFTSGWSTIYCSCISEMIRWNVPSHHSVGHSSNRRRLFSSGFGCQNMIDWGKTLERHLKHVGIRCQNMIDSDVFQRFMTQERSIEQDVMNAAAIQHLQLSPLTGIRPILWMQLLLPTVIRSRLSVVRTGTDTAKRGNWKKNRNDYISWTESPFRLSFSRRQHILSRISFSFVVLNKVTHLEQNILFLSLSQAGNISWAESLFL
jgi:hypothetical protein